MPEFTSYPAGIPCWVDLASPDPEASAAFYGGMFGWSAHRSPDPGANGYTMFMIGDKMVAGLGPIMAPQQPAAWSTYIAVDDADAVAVKVLDAGGQVVMKPMDVMTAGRMGVFLDPTGAAISVWQADEHHGAQLANEPNTFCWNELNTRDVSAATAFYSAVFGWSVAEADDATALPMEYYGWQLAGPSFAGMMPMPEMVPASVPSFWFSYFAVEDTDAAITRALSLGGKVVAGPIDIPAGRFAVLGGPHGEPFGVIKM